MSACQEILLYFLAMRLSQDKGYHVEGSPKTGSQHFELYIWVPCFGKATCVGLRQESRITGDSSGQGHGKSTAHLFWEAFVNGIPA